MRDGISFSGVDLRDKEVKACVYFVRLIGQPYAKVGFAADKWANRLRLLQCGSPFPYDILLLASGPQQAERATHKALFGHGVRGEWFDYNDTFVRFLVGFTQSQKSLLHFAEDFYADRIAEIDRKRDKALAAARAALTAKLDGATA